jgi:hypothetical protein
MLLMGYGLAQNCFPSRPDAAAKSSSQRSMVDIQAAVMRGAAPIRMQRADHTRCPAREGNWMARILYAHRFAKHLDEIVRDLGLTMTLSDGGADVDLAKNLDNVKVAATSLGLDVKVETVGSETRVTFKRK